MKNEVRPIDANALADEVASLRIAVTGLRAGKGVLAKWMYEYRKSVLCVIQDQATLSRESNHFPDLTKMVPLTLDQLREMDGQPVWVKVLDTRFNEENQWAICNADYQMVTLKDGFKLFFCGYESNWLAYTYPPAHIDREAWKCPLCERSKVISFKAWEDEEACHEGGPFIQGGAIFCPHCGKPRTPEAWAEMEKRMGV